MDELGITSNEAIMIGDSLSKDIKGAQAANIWFNPNCKENMLNIVPDYEINDLREVIDLLDFLNKEN